MLLCFLVACAAAALGWGDRKRSLAPPREKRCFTQPPKIDLKLDIRAEKNTRLPSFSSFVSYLNM